LAFKVIEFGANREPVYDFLLVINSKLGLISHRYWDTATYWRKIANFAYPLSFSAVGWPPTNLWKSFTVPETTVFQAPEGEDLHRFCLMHPCDVRTELRWLRRAESSSCFRA